MFIMLHLSPLMPVPLQKSSEFQLFLFGEGISLLPVVPVEWKNDDP